MCRQDFIDLIQLYFYFAVVKPHAAFNYCLVNVLHIFFRKEYNEIINDECSILFLNVGMNI